MDDPPTAARGAALKDDEEDSESAADRLGRGSYRREGPYEVSGFSPSSSTLSCHSDFPGASLQICAWITDQLRINTYDCGSSSFRRRVSVKMRIRRQATMDL
jgi:hypothetical protein